MSERTIEDRRLGDEWSDWDGMKCTDADTGVEVFIIFTSLALLVLAAIGLFALWLIQPRLTLISVHLEGAFNYAVHGLIASAAIWLIIFTIGLVTERHVFLGILRATRVLDFLLPTVFAIAQRIGFDRDRLSNAFIKANNMITRPFVRALKSHELLILLPRCLTRVVMDDLKGLRERFGFEMEVVGGGEAARAAIGRTRPRAVIAVACERDLLSGIRDVGHKIAVYAFPNSRPEGPCKNTIVDVARVEVAVRHVLGETRVV